MENFFVYKNTKIFYEYKKENQNETILFLHGWGASIDVMKVIGDQILNKNKLYIDFPPFGKSEEPQTPWTIYDYANMTKALCDKLSIKNIIIISHSFGGRVALILSNVYNNIVSKIVLIDAAGLLPKRSLKYHFKVLWHKLKRIFNKNVSGGSKDYKMLSDVMKQTFKNVVNENLKQFAKNNNIPTLIIWGKNDTETPIYMAKKLNKYIKNSGLVIIENAGHFCFLEYFNYFMTILNEFI